jgi:hypothetical protein
MTTNEIITKPETKLSIIFKDKLEEICLEISSITDTAEGLIIENESDYQMAIDFLRNIKSARKIAADFISPIKKEIKSIEANIIKPIDTVEKDIKDKAENFGLIKTKGTAIRHIWRAVVTDEKLLPEEWWVRSVNNKALQEFAEKTKGEVAVPGVEFLPEEILSIRRV